MNEIKTLGKHVILKKIEDLPYSGHYPDETEVGFQLKGQAINDIVEGEILVIGEFHTSRILEISSYNTFRTKNSVYQIEVAA